PRVSSGDIFGDRAPRFLAYPRTFTVQSGADALLKCQITGDPQPSIAWEKDKAPIAPAGRFRVQAEGNMYSLLVSRVTPEDGGQYICKAKNSVGETYAAATLKVEPGEPRCEGHPDDRAPVFLARPLSLRVGRGEDVAFSCRVLGQPGPVLEWEKDGRKLSDLFESSHFCVGKEPEDWHFLRIFGSRPPDGGVYVCRARNRAGEALAAAVLLPEPWAALTNGEAAPSAPRAKAFAVSEGKHAKFRCYVTGKPKPEIVWKKDGKAVVPGRRHLAYEDREGYFILKVLYCKPQDQGLYVCTASNTAGQTLSAVQLRVREHRVRFQVQLEDVEVQEREDAVLECRVPLETIPTAWYLEDKPLQPSPKYLMEEQGRVRRLTIRDARTDDDGIYLCEMQDQGRSVAEVSVRGMIVKRLPRKLDVMEGENAAFCVETREAVEGISWRRNGQELQESPCTVLKSFGKTHLLVLVHVTREDAGIIAFAVGDSETLAQLRVKCAKRVPPSTPVAACMSTEHSNAALLTWCPAPDVHRSPPGAYVLERQEAGTAEWVQCLTTDTAGAVEVLGDSVPAEADYRFRLCAVNKYGCSAHVEFPGAAHLVPLARVERALQDAVVQEGEDAIFSLELSALVRGAWFLNGARVPEEEEEEGRRCCIWHSKTEHALQIRRVRLTEDGAEVRFVAHGLQDVAMLHVQEPPVRVVSSNEAAVHAYMASERVELVCELSRPDAPVQWYKDGVEVEESERLVLQREGPCCRLVLPSAQPSDTGEYMCNVGGDSVFYSITVAEPPVQVVSSNEAAVHTYVASERVELVCELSRPNAPVQWYKDGVEVEESERLVLQRSGPCCRLVLPSAQPPDTGEYVCDVGGDSVFYNVTVAVAPWAVHSNKVAAHMYVALERVELVCELSRPDAPVQWYKDGVEVEESKRLMLQRLGPCCRLVLPSAQPLDTGEYMCDAGSDSVFYNVTVAEPPVRVVSSNESAVHTYAASERVELVCELSRPDAPVQWYKDGVEVEESEQLVLQREGPCCWLVLPSAQPPDTGEYVCDAGGDSVFYNVTVAGQRPSHSSVPLPLSPLCSLPSTPAPSLSRVSASVQWAKDGAWLEAGGSLILEEEGAHRRLVIPVAGPEHSGKYICNVGNDARTFTVQGDLQTQRHCRAGEDLVLEVQLSHAHGEAKWYKDGEKLQDTGRVRVEEDGARRALVVLGVESRDAGEYLCESGAREPGGPWGPLLLALSPPFPCPEPPVSIVGSAGARERRCVVAGEDLILACEVSRPNAAVRWLRDGRELAPSEHVRVVEKGCLRQLTILGAQHSDAGSYVCDAGTDQRVMSVQVAGESLGKGPQGEHWLHGAVEGDTVTLMARLSRDTAPVRWLRDRRLLRAGARLQVGSEGPCRSLTLKHAEPGDSGAYCCDAGDDAVHFTLRVRGERPCPAPAPAPMRTPPSRPCCPALTCLRHPVPLARAPTDMSPWPAEAPVLFVNKQEKQEKVLVLEGGSAVLSAVVSKEQAAVSWAGPCGAVAAGERCELRREGRVHSLVLSNGGGHWSRAGGGVALRHGPNPALRLVPPELLVKFVRGLSDVHAHKGETVLLWCELCKARGDVTWLKDGQVLVPGGRGEARVEGRERSLVLSNVGPEDAGEYCCESKDDRTLAMLRGFPRVVEIISELRNLTVMEGEDATFKCVVSPEDVALTWQLGGQVVAPSERLVVSTNGLCHALTIQQCQPGDATTVTANAEGLVSAARLSVQGEKSWRGCRGHLAGRGRGCSDACLEVELSHAGAEVQWLKQGVLLQPGAKYQLQEAGCRRTLTIRSLSPSDRGTYRCETLHDRTQAKLSVERE
uniref:Obscurin-like protein 1 n=1 Tax=Crocodylus porosus TaxID=8502 RepID=A0A7M4FQ79_CROPO